MGGRQFVWFKSSRVKNNMCLDLVYSRGGHNFYILRFRGIYLIYRPPRLFVLNFITSHVYNLVNILNFLEFHNGPYNAKCDYFGR
jgi:hypothetical protein